MELHSRAFGDNFIWGVASSAYQTEGAYIEDGKGLSIWDLFTQRKGKIIDLSTGNTATDFYHRCIQDIILMEFLNIPNFRFSLSWSRLFPDGTNRMNDKGVEFYNRVIDFCLECNIEPWITLYHWDLPQELESKGGWTNRDIIYWFEQYVAQCISLFGDRVKNWMILNEPMAFTGAGYFLGIHAPGRRGLSSFLPAVHHAALCQAIGINTAKSISSQLQVGTTFSCAAVDPVDSTDANLGAAKRVDVLSNRLFIEPLLGLGYPSQDLKILTQIEKYFKDGDNELIKASPDFVGLQNYTREVVQYSNIMPYLNAKIVKANKRNVPTTEMDWEVYPEGLYRVLHRFNSYEGIKKIIVTENGAAFNDKVIDGRVDDPERISFYKAYLQQALKAKAEGVKLGGYFAWSFTDNFEWAEGFTKRFGLVYVDYTTQKRVIKSSGFWFQNFLNCQQRKVSEFNSVFTNSSC